MSLVSIPSYLIHQGFACVSDVPQTVTVTPNSADVRETQSITLTCQADGHPPPTFSWKFNGNVVNGAQQNTLVLTSVEVKDAGNYTCVASNSLGSKEVTRVVNVLCKLDHLLSYMGIIRVQTYVWNRPTHTCNLHLNMQAKWL